VRGEKILLFGDAEGWMRKLTVGGDWWEGEGVGGEGSLMGEGWEGSDWWEGGKKMQL
jgi:hypothetical protein